MWLCISRCWVPHWATRNKGEAWFAGGAGSFEDGLQSWRHQKSDWTPTCVDRWDAVSLLITAVVELIYHAEFILAVTYRERVNLQPWSVAAFSRIELYRQDYCIGMTLTWQKPVHESIDTLGVSVWWCFRTMVSFSHVAVAYIRKNIFCCFM